MSVIIRALILYTHFELKASANNLKSHGLCDLRASQLPVQYANIGASTAFTCVFSACELYTSSVGSEETILAVDDSTCSRYCPGLSNNRASMGNVQFIILVDISINFLLSLHARACSA